MTRVRPAPSDLLKARYRALRLWMRRFGGLRSAWYFGRAVVEGISDSSGRSRRSFAHAFTTPDPWAISTATVEKQRHRDALELIRSVQPREGFASALEIGCAEGHFTCKLTDCCRSLLAVDFSDVALQRARSRCQGASQVTFAPWDLRRDPVPDNFDLVVLMGVLEVFRNPLAIRRARATLVSALEPGGYLLISNSRIPEWMEQAWWTQPFVRGGAALNRFFAACPSLERVATRTTDRYIASLFRRTDVSGTV